MTIRSDLAGIRYRDETPADRDTFGVLWARVRQAPGEGRPNFPAMHPARQRQVQAERLCQVCGGTASHTRDGWLFLMNDDEDCYEGARVTKPPVCLPCAALAVRLCPHLTNPVGVRSRRPKIWGVFGTLFGPTPNAQLKVHEDDHLPYGHRASDWFLATQLVVQLKRCTVVDLDTELAALT
ncbi:hypothetical protein FH609_020290 [Streptomyces sp. 3MP-14]|uniref:Uncharacterized protein n=1 Tax=Streptomyces mimosae TaxID=2586635 RepID=A0A5N6A367_9ACTN|nr:MULTISPECIES: hypothetical protein [Streptomyces]KAB8161808.1 hypothetical protein FH607_024130 [Streptomyces mimosae]KAB8174924.1 hypothetical protein FH609_020290 [Streptomyces sp. 3MP-14]